MYINDDENCSLHLQKKEKKKNICSYVVVAMLKVRVFKRNVDINWITFTLGKTVLRLNDFTDCQEIISFHRAHWIGPKWCLFPLLFFHNNYYVNIVVYKKCNQ